MSQQPHYLSTRDNWEAAANTTGSSLRDTVHSTLQELLDQESPDTYSVTIEPKDFSQFYLEEDYAIHPELYQRPAAPAAGDIWFDADTNKFLQFKGGARNTVVTAQCGFIPDVKVVHRPSGNAYFIECKAQNDVGNAHERCAKYASPSVIAGMQRKLGVSYHPIGYLFSGTIVTKRKYILELQSTFRFAEGHLFLWQPDRPRAALAAWIRPLLQLLVPRA